MQFINLGFNSRVRKILWEPKFGPSLISPRAFLSLTSHVNVLHLGWLLGEVCGYKRRMSDHFALVYMCISNIIIIIIIIGNIFWKSKHAHICPTGSRASISIQSLEDFGSCLRWAQTAVQVWLIVFQTQLDLNWEGPLSALLIAFIDSIQCFSYPPNYTFATYKFLIALVLHVRKSPVVDY